MTTAYRSTIPGLPKILLTEDDVKRMLSFYAVMRPEAIPQSDDEINRALGIARISRRAA